MPETTGDGVQLAGPRPEDLNAVLTSDLRVTVTATDSTGLQSIKVFPVLPKIADVSFNATRPDAVLVVEGIAFKGLRGFKAWSMQPLVVEASARAGLYKFKRWRDGVTSRWRIVTSRTADYFEAQYSLL